MKQLFCTLTVVLIRLLDQVLHRVVPEVEELVLDVGVGPEHLHEGVHQELLDVGTEVGPGVLEFVNVKELAFTEGCFDIYTIFHVPRLCLYKTWQCI